MKALIIGDGPSRELVINNLEKISISYDIYSIHYPITQCKGVVSLDLTQYHIKEKLAIEKGIPLILGDNVCPPTLLNKIKNVIIYRPKRMRGNSGAFAIEWCISKGYTEIYTAGLDFTSDYIIPQALENINRYVVEMNKIVKIYKVSEISGLNCPIKFP